MKHKFINKENGKIASVLVVYLDDEEHMQMNSYDKVEDLLADYGAYECAEGGNARAKRYRLVKDLPTFKAGDEFFSDPDGSLWLDQEIDGEPNSSRVMAYNRATLEKFPNILQEWFEPIEKSESSSENYELGHFKIKRPKNAEAILRDMEKPLIKDEKVRKAVRAEANELSEKLRVINEHFDCCKIFGRSDSRNVCLEIEFKSTIAFADKNKLYPIEELCGEEE